jgi:hypothetical protein
MNKRFLSVREAAEFLKVSQSGCIYQGRLGALRPPRRARTTNESSRVALTPLHDNAPLQKANQILKETPCSNFKSPVSIG